MKEAMVTAEVGDDVFRDDPSVLRLEQHVAKLFGFEAGLYCTSGTQSNLVGIMAHCQRGDEYIVGQQAHTYKWEAGGAAVLGSVQPQPLNHNPDGTLPLEDIESAIKADDPHFARTRLLALENTFGGRVISQDYIKAATSLAHSKGLRTHLDGARIFNAIVKQNLDPKQAVAGFDSVSVCLSKGLGAPVGSVLLGDKELIAKGLRLRKILGGGLRQWGHMAAAGLYAIQNNVSRLAEDHANAATLAQGLASIPGVKIVSPDTNIVFVSVSPKCVTALALEFAANQILIRPAANMRFVTHLDLSAADVSKVLQVTKRFFRNWSPELNFGDTMELALERSKTTFPK
jgi:threonine aldolase